jgi:hypothetical protein
MSSLPVLPFVQDLEQRPNGGQIQELSIFSTQQNTSIQ